MKYIVTRTSDWHRSIKEKPCDECYEENVKCTNSRAIRSETMLLEICPNWYKDTNYFNHRFEDNMFKRDYYEKRFVIDINSLEDLNNFVDKYNEIVLYTRDDVPTIEIYDDWRE